MSGWHHEGCFKEKRCLVCESPFVPSSGVHKFCSEKCKGKWKYISGELTTEKQYENISGNWKRYLSRLTYVKGRKRSEISVEDLLEKLKEQDGKCALSGITLTCNLEKGVNFKTNVSVDRIEAGGPYIKENIQLVCKALNGFRTDTDLKEFIWWCKKVAEYNDN